MPNKPNILVIVQYNRKDYIDLFSSCLGYCNFFFIDYASDKDIITDYYTRFGTAIFWGNFRDAEALLLEIKPTKVVFFFIETYFHVILNLACKKLGIPTYLMDHGIRDLNINLRFEKHLISQTTTLPSPLAHLKKLTQFRARVKARFFLLNSIKNLSKAEADFYRRFHKVRSTRGYIVTLNEIKSPLRIADAYIAFSFKTFEVHRHYDHLPSNKKAYFIGLPIYDHLAVSKPAEDLNRQLIFIDQGLAIRGFFNWTSENYRQFIQLFSSICLQHGYQLLIKLHPAQPESDAGMWKAYQNVQIISDEELSCQLSFTPLIAGFYSTLLLPIIAHEHTTVITLENHPIGRIDVSKSFTEAGVAHPVYDLEELHGVLENVAELHRQQLPHKPKFTEEWMYKFDGKSGERLRQILLKEGL